MKGRAETHGRLGCIIYYPIACPEPSGPEMELFDQVSHQKDRGMSQVEEVLVVPDLYW